MKATVLRILMGTGDGNPHKSLLNIFIAFSKRRKRTDRPVYASRLAIMESASEELKKEEMERRSRKYSMKFRLKKAVIENSARLKLANTFITEARMGDELEGTTWSEYLPIDELYHQTPQFVDILLELKTLIIAERSNYEFATSHEKRRPNAKRRTEV